MKKIITALIISAFVIVLGGTTIFAAGRGRQASQNAAGNPQCPAAGTGYACSVAGQYFTDTDGDGICDYRNTDDRSEVCPYNNNCTPEYRHHASCKGNAAQSGHREHHGSFR